MTNANCDNFQWPVTLTPPCLSLVLISSSPVDNLNVLLIKMTVIHGHNLKARNKPRRVPSHIIVSSSLIMLPLSWLTSWKVVLFIVHFTAYDYPNWNEYEMVHIDAHLDPCLSQWIMWVGWDVTSNCHYHKQMWHKETFTWRLWLANKIEWGFCFSSKNLF